jgi:hypothetical protein
MEIQSLNLIEPELGEESGALPVLARNSASQTSTRSSQHGPVASSPVESERPEPAPQSVFEEDPPDSEGRPAAGELAHVLDRLTEYYGECIVCPRWMLHTMVLWTAGTYCINIRRISPILYVTSSEGESGTTRVLLTLARFVRKALVCSHVSGPAVYRWVHSERPTLVLDGADALFSRSKDMQGILAGATNRGTARVALAKKEDYNQYSGELAETGTDMLLAGRSKLPDKLRSCSLVLHMHPKEHGKPVTRVEFDNRAKLRMLAEELERRVKAELDGIEAVMPTLPHISGLSDRVVEMWETMRAIAARAGDHWPASAVEAARALSVSKGASKEALRPVMLGHVETVFQSAGVAKMRSAELLAALCANPEWPWATYNDGSPMLHNQMSEIIGVRTQNVGDGRKGYFRSKLEEARRKYVGQDEGEPIEEAEEPIERFRLAGRRRKAFGRLP